MVIRTFVTAGAEPSFKADHLSGYSIWFVEGLAPVFLSDLSCLHSLAVIRQSGQEEAAVLLRKLRNCWRTVTLNVSPAAPCRVLAVSRNRKRYPGILGRRDVLVRIY